MAVKIDRVLGCLAEIAPFDKAEEWDNIGLIVGDGERETDAIVFALDLSDRVLDEAIACGARLIVAHHPILFRGAKKILSGTPEGRLIAGLIKNDIAFVAMHTNYDAAEQGVNRVLAERLGLTDIVQTESGMCAGNCDAGTFGELVARVDQALITRSRGYGAEDKKVARVAVMGGSGGSYAREAQTLGADAFVTGEISYHTGLDMAAEGMNAIEAGHYETEKWAMPRLAELLAVKLGDAAPLMIMSDTLQLREMEV